MQTMRWTRILGAAVVTAGWLLSGNLHATDGYSLEDFTLSTADDLADICAVEIGHEDYEVATAFCYGFIEGAIHYDNAVAGSEWYEDIVCHPTEITRAQTVMVYSAYMKANPQYGSEQPIDAIFRALVAKWPCTE